LRSAALCCGICRSRLTTMLVRFLQFGQIRLTRRILYIDDGHWSPLSPRGSVGGARG
jgi:hypothetical protein